MNWSISSAESEFSTNMLEAEMTHGQQGLKTFTLLGKKDIKMILNIIMIKLRKGKFWRMYRDLVI